MRYAPLIVLSCTMPAAASTLTFYSSRSAWEAATLDRIVLATFSEPLWPINQVLVGSWTLNGVTYRGLAGTPSHNIFVINPSPLTGPALTANGDENIDIVFTQTVRSVSFDVAVNRFGPVFVRVYDALAHEMGVREIPATTIGFFGVTSVGGIARINFRSVNGAVQDSLLDNVTRGGVRCPADLNADGVVDDADFSVFVVSYNALVCDDPVVAPGCPGDLNLDGVTDDADFIIFAQAYNELLCP